MSFGRHKRRLMSIIKKYQVEGADKIDDSPQKSRPMPSESDNDKEAPANVQFPGLNGSNENSRSVGVDDQENCSS